MCNVHETTVLYRKFNIKKCYTHLGGEKKVKGQDIHYTHNTHTHIYNIILHGM